MKRTNISDITWIYDKENETLHIQERNQPERELTVKGTTNKGGKWYQVDEERRHWISFNPDKFNNQNVEVFYKCVNYDRDLTDFWEPQEITYYRKMFKGVERGDGTIIFSFSEFDEWILENGKWKSKEHQ
ncbi:hypothetical protein GvMRE_Ic5g56 [endosymbiont GvMRE of Glomus versiforme]|nr:hypothetical protein GvMRE_Ic5g56 [endosymbiont GvMRE of Glomus versiforme]